MGKWLDKLRPASYRGLPFVVIEDPESQVGRRNVDHEFAGRDDPYSEDLGRKQRSYSLVGAVFGEDFIEKAHALEAAFEEEGPGLLVHPFYGELYVTATASFTYRGRQATFAIDAKEAGQEANPGSETDTQALITSKAIEAEAAAISQFEESFSVEGAGFLSEAALANIEALTDVITTAFDTADAAQKKASLISSALGDSSLLYSPAILANRLLSTLYGNNLTEVITPIAGRIAGLKAVSASINSTSNQPLSAAFSNSPLRIQQAQNTTAINRLMSQSASIEAAKEISLANFEHQSEAVSIAGDVTDMLEAASWESDDQGYKALSELRLAVQQDMQRRSPALPVLSTVTLAQSVPSLVAAYQATGSAVSEQRIVDRNGISHPGFIHGEIEVINA